MPRRSRDSRIETMLRSLVICHEIPLRYIVNGSAGSDALDGPSSKIANARPYLFTEVALTRGAALIRKLADGSSRTA